MSHDQILPFRNYVSLLRYSQGRQANGADWQDRELAAFDAGPVAVVDAELARVSR